VWELFITTVLILFANTVIFAEKINWDIIKEQTLSNNPSIKIAKLELDNARLSYNNSVSGYFPKINLYAQTLETAYGGGNSRFSETSYEINYSLPIFSGFSTYNDIKDKSAKLEISQAIYNRTVSDAIYKTKVDYINLMWVYEHIELLKKIKIRRCEVRDIIKLKYHSGSIDVGPLKRASADVMSAEYELKKAERYIKIVSMNLLKSTGTADSVEIFDTDERLNISKKIIKEIDFKNVINIIPEFLISKYSVKSFKAQNSKIKSQWFPNIDASGCIFGKRKQDPDIKIFMTYPIFTSGVRYRTAKIASNELEIAYEKLKETISLLKSQALGYCTDLFDLYELIDVDKKYLDAVRLQTEILSKKYVSGWGTYHDWYLSENDYVNYQIKLLEDKRAVILKEAEWCRFMGEKK
jgi:outer membrane protein TolC